LRGGVVAGSLAWSVPVIYTLATPSAAAGTPLDGISSVAIVLRVDGSHYRMRWAVQKGALALETGPGFVMAGSHQMSAYADIQPGAAPGAGASLVGETVRVAAVGTQPDLVLVDYVVQQRGCSWGPGTAALPAIGSSGPWDFTPLASASCGG
jgi:hypothetical protein